MITIAGKQFIKDTLETASKELTDYITSSAADVANDEDMDINPQQTRIDNGQLALAFNTIHERCGLDCFPRTKPALALLDNLNCSRASLYEELLGHIKNQIELSTESLNENEIMLLLKDTIKFIGVKELQSVPILLIKKLRKIPPKILELLHSKGILDDMPLYIQQCAWKENTKLFRLKLENIIQSNSSNNLSVNNKALMDLISYTTSLIGKEESLLVDFSTFCVEGCQTNPQLHQLLRKIYTYMQDNNCRIPTLGKIFDFAAHVEVLINNNKKTLKIPPLETELCDMLLVIINSEMALREKEQQNDAKKLRPLITSVPMPTPAVVPVFSQKDFEDAWTFLSELDVSGVFANPVTDEIAPGYSKKIKSPMDLSTLKMKITGYKDLATMDADVRLMFRNCKDFNVQGPFVKMAGQYLREWVKYRDRMNAIAKGETPIATTDGPARKKQKAERANIMLGPPGVAPSLHIPAAAQSSSSSSSLTSSLLSSIAISSRDLKKDLIEAWSLLDALDTQHLFANPVTEKVAPRYFSVIKQPMDLGTIHLKIDRNLYKSFSLFNDDVLLMLANCIQYNPPKSQIYKYAEIMRKEWESLIIKYTSDEKSNEKIRAPGTTSTVKAETSLKDHEKLNAELIKSPSANKAKSTLSSTTASTFVLPTDLPALFESSKVSWAICILKDSAIQSILRSRFINLVDLLLLDSLTNMRYMLIFESKQIRNCLQLIQLSWNSSAFYVESCNLSFLRKLIPAFVIALLEHEEDKLDFGEISTAVLCVHMPNYEPKHQLFLCDIGKGIFKSVQKLARRRNKQN